MASDLTENVKVCLRCIGADDDQILCLIFHETKQVLITLWSLNDHVELLPRRFAYVLYCTTSPNMFDLSSDANDTLYLATGQGDVWVLNLLKMKTTTKVQNLTVDESASHQYTILPGQEWIHLKRLTDTLIAVSTSRTICLFHRDDFWSMLQTIEIAELLFSWTLMIQDDHRCTLITVDSSQQFISVYRPADDGLAISDPMKIQFHSCVEFIKLMPTTTIIDSDETKKVYVLILLDDDTLQLLDTNQLSPSSLRPNGMYTRIKNYHVRSSCVRVASCADRRLKSALSLARLRKSLSVPKVSWHILFHLECERRHCRTPTGTSVELQHLLGTYGLVADRDLL